MSLLVPLVYVCVYGTRMQNTLIPRYHVSTPTYVTWSKCHAGESSNRSQLFWQNEIWCIDWLRSRTKRRSTVRYIWSIEVCAECVVSRSYTGVPHRYGLRGRELINQVGRSMVEMGGTFGLLLAIGTAIRSCWYKFLTQTTRMIRAACKAVTLYQMSSLCVSLTWYLYQIVMPTQCNLVILIMFHNSIDDTHTLTLSKYSFAFISDFSIPWPNCKHLPTTKQAVAIPL